jgi:hypothetical protein
MMLDVLRVSPAQFACKPQVGTHWSCTWRELADFLATPAVARLTGDDDRDKAQAGAWSPALYGGNVRQQSAIEHVDALVVDIDQGGDVTSVAEVLGRYRAIVHSTFKSRPEAPRCRAVIALAEPMDVDTYKATHAVVRAHLAALGMIVDRGASDASRLSYAPVVRPGASYDYRANDGEPLDARAVLAAQPTPAPRTARTTSTHADAYLRGALQRAADAVAAASPGERHYTLCREAWSLARLELNEDVIAGALLPAFLATAGEARRCEGERTIHDGIRARRGTA